MVGPYPLLCWLMRRVVQVGQEALCKPGGATFCFWSINNAGEAMVPSLCLDDRSQRLLFLSRTLLDLWRLPPWLAVERQTSAHLAISLIFMSAPWGVNERRRCHRLSVKLKKIKSNRAVGLNWGQVSAIKEVRNRTVMERKMIIGGLLIGSRLEILLICCKSYPLNTRGFKGGPYQWTKILIMCWPGKTHNSQSHFLWRASCFTLGVIHLLASCSR